MIYVSDGDPIYFRDTLKKDLKILEFLEKEGFIVTTDYGDMIHALPTCIFDVDEVDEYISCSRINDHATLLF